MTIGIGAEGTGDAGSSAAGERASFVTSDGFVLVHRGDVISTGYEDQAQVTLAEADAQLTVTVHLPVLVDLGSSAADVDAIVDEAMRRLRAAVEARTEMA